MAKYSCKQFPFMSFYVGDVKKQFHAGVYETADAKEIKVLDAMSFVSKVVEAPKVEAPKTDGPKGTDGNQNVPHKK